MNDASSVLSSSSSPPGDDDDDDNSDDTSSSLAFIPIFISFFIVALLDALTESELDDPDLINGKARERIATTTGDDDDDDMLFYTVLCYTMLCYAIIIWCVVLCHVLHHDMYRTCCMVMVASSHD
jgi:hypothetical protein